MAWYHKLFNICPHDDAEQTSEPFFVKPMSFGFSGWGVDPTIIDKYYHGYTVFSWRCKQCGQRWSTERTGKHI